MAINHNQRKYALERVQIIVNQASRKIREESSARKMPFLNAADKCHMIVNGTAEMIPELVRPSTKYGDVPDITDCFRYPGEEATAEFNRKLEEEQEKRIDALLMEANRVKDEIMLGDAQEALNHIRDFSEKEW